MPSVHVHVNLFSMRVFSQSEFIVFVGSMADRVCPWPIFLHYHMVDLRLLSKDGVLRSLRVIVVDDKDIVAFAIKVAEASEFIVINLECIFDTTINTFLEPFLFFFKFVY